MKMLIFGEIIYKLEIMKMRLKINKIKHYKKELIG